MARRAGRPDPEFLRAHIHYNALTGQFWRNGKCIGYIAGKGYVQFQVKGYRLYGHSAAWAMHYGVWPTYEPDHINGIKSDNRIDNLRDVTRSINMKNMPGRGKTGHRGITLSKVGNYQVYSTLYHKTYYIGTFTSIGEAVAARDEFEAKVVGVKLRG